MPQWYQSGFFKDRENELRHLKHREIKLKNSPSKVVESKNWFSQLNAFTRKTCTQHSSVKQLMMILRKSFSDRSMTTVQTRSELFLPMI